jgi:hypothetical protein
MDIHLEAKTLANEFVRGLRKPSSIYGETGRIGGIDDASQSKLTFTEG